MGNAMVQSFFKAHFSIKRKASLIDSDSESETDINDLDKYEFDSKKCEQRRKAAKTSKYIYKTLFEEQQGSDVKITALNRSWNLHKLYLSQSPYFNSMFNGDWLESQKKEIDIDIVDKNVTVEALHKVFSSFYQDEIEIKPEEAIAVLGATSLMQLDDLSLQCVHVMKRNVNINTVFTYYDCADFYSLKQLKEIAFDWLLKNLLYRISRSPQHLQQMSCELISELIENPNLIVIQTEFSLYRLLKKWLFLKESKCTIYDELKLDHLADDYFRNTCSTPYLLSPSGLKYHRPFLALRKYHLISHMMDLDVIRCDNIIPTEWLLPVFKQQWYQMLQIEEGTDTGPSCIGENDFNKYSLRCGRVIRRDSETNWRWTGFNYGVDLVVNYNKGTVSLSRGQSYPPPYEVDTRSLYQVLYKDKKRSIMFRIGVYSLDKKGRVIKRQETGVQNITLSHRQKRPVLNFESEMVFPVLFSANFLVTTPLGEMQNFTIDSDTVLGLKERTLSECQRKRIRSLRKSV